MYACSYSALNLYNAYNFYVLLLKSSFELVLEHEKTDQILFREKLRI